METIRFKVFVFSILLIALVGILRFIQKKELQLKYALIWILVDVLMMIAVLIPGTLMGLANILGVYSVTNMLFFLGIMFTLAIIFSLTVALSRASERIRKLSQQVALNEYEHILEEENKYDDK
ncbi:hypothetical protein SAMN02910377_00929 [Pseudobutyrivibrio ruminis]|uniref:DUF2304 domain-containing protein n=1 Tax=Pseudobutyrivibrio ruminis TaxID=46206 RepID=A0A1H7H4Y9_9FIRM|nr:DUF2304 domain-containing protein [Pseudobutyrivibrio ruminis]SEK45503.1 hypothetical protein SAMN02910377_00929 [Pseudobutyrivibrio ruminis]